MYLDELNYLLIPHPEFSYQLDYAYLFGSHAKGTSNQWSDIDLAIVSPDFSEDLYEERLVLMRLAAEIDDRIEPKPFRPEMFTPIVEGGGKLRQLAARNCDTGSISDPLSIFLSIENLCFSASSSDWQRRRFFLPPGLAQTVALPVGLYDVTPVGQAV